MTRLWFAFAGTSLSRHARHYYDVFQLLGDRAVILNIRADPAMVATYGRQAHDDTVAHGMSTSPRPANGFGISPAFTDRAFLEHAREEYTREMGYLGFGVVPDFDMVVARAVELAPLL